MLDFYSIWSNLPYGPSFWARDSFPAYWHRGLREADRRRRGLTPFFAARGDGPLP
jgi:hypothetical protein